MDKTNKNLISKILLFSIIGIAVGTLFIYTFVLKQDKKISRTVMIYMVGSDLETKSGLATIDLNSIKYDKMDNENVNVVLLAGGTIKWKNDYISSDETSIYELKNGGFKKVKKNSILNMGDSKVFSNFLNYVYDNYKTDKYDLIFWNHGGAIYGSEFDDLSNDFLSLSEIKKGFKNSPFKDKNKLETIIFRTCLNGTLEVGTILDDYSDYLVASEETTIGTPFTSVLNFINDIDVKDNGYNVSLKFIEAYKKQIKDYKSLYNKKLGTKDGLYSTYSIVKLSNIDKLTTTLNDFISDIDITANYNKIAKVRSNLYQYAYTQAEEPLYDMVDLYNLIDKIKSISPKKGDKVLNEFKNTVVYNWATNSNSRGISIYFPYNGNSKYKTMFLKIYQDFDDLRAYRKFIYKFAEIQHSSKKKYSFTKNDTKVSTSNETADFSLELTDDQKEGFATAQFLVFQGNEGDEYYRPIYKGKNVKLNGNTLSASIKGRQLRVKSKKDKTDKGLVFTLFENTETDKYLNYNTYVVLGNLDKETLAYKAVAANMKITLNKQNNNIFVSSIIETDKEKDELKVDNIAVNLKDYKTIAFGSSKYNLVNSDGTYNENFSSNGTYEGMEYDTDEFEFILENFEKTSDYYCVFIIKDVNNNTYYSKIVKMK